MGDSVQQATRRVIALVVGVAACGWSASVSAAPVVDDEPIEARLEIDTSEAGSAGDVLRRRIEERANIVLRHAKILPGDRDDVALTVTVDEIEGDEPGYAVRFELRRGDGSMIDAPTEVECRLCTETELVARVEAELAAIAEALRELDDEAQAIETPIEAKTPEPPAPTAQPPEPRGSAGMLGGGITLLIAGTGLLGAGVGLAIPEPRVDQANPLDLITTRPIGYGLLAGGVVLATTGAVLTAIAIKRRRPSRSSAQVSIVPFGGRTHAGLILGMRFQ